MKTNERRIDFMGTNLIFNLSKTDLKETINRVIRKDNNQNKQNLTNNSDLTGIYNIKNAYNYEQNSMHNHQSSEKTNNYINNKNNDNSFNKSNNKKKLEFNDLKIIKQLLSNIIYDEYSEKTVKQEKNATHYNNSINLQNIKTNTAIPDSKMIQETKVNYDDEFIGTGVNIRNKLTNHCQYNKLENKYYCEKLTYWDSEDEDEVEPSQSQILSENGTRDVDTQTKKTLKISTVDRNKIITSEEFTTADNQKVVSQKNKSSEKVTPFDKQRNRGKKSKELSRTKASSSIVDNKKSKTNTPIRDSKMIEETRVNYNDIFDQDNKHFDSQYEKTPKIYKFIPNRSFKEISTEDRNKMIAAEEDTPADEDKKYISKRTRSQKTKVISNGVLYEPENFSWKPPKQRKSQVCDDSPFLQFKHGRVTKSTILPVIFSDN